MNKNLLVKIRNISLTALFLTIAASFFLDRESCYYYGLDILIGIGFVGILSTSMVWNPDLFMCIYTDIKTPPDKIPAWRDVEPSRKRVLALAALLVLGIGIYLLYVGISKLITQACV